MAPHGAKEGTMHERRDIRPRAADQVGRRKPSGAGRTWRRTAHAVAEKMLPAPYRPSVPPETRDVPWKVLLADVWGVLGFASIRLCLPCGIVTAMLCVFAFLGSLESLDGIVASPGVVSPFPSTEAFHSFMRTATRYATVATGACAALAGLFLLVQKGD
jgi:hypothetical protein